MSLPSCVRETRVVAMGPNPARHARGKSQSRRPVEGVKVASAHRKRKANTSSAAWKLTAGVTLGDAITHAVEFEFG